MRVLLRSIVGIACSLFLQATVCFGQVPLAEEKLLEKLVAIEERFSEIRSSCFVVMVEERSTDDPDELAPAMVRLEHIYANDDDKGLRRNDAGLCGTAYSPKSELSWYWSRSLRIRGKPELRINSPDGEPFEKERPYLIKPVDPLAITISPFGAVSTGMANESWYSQIFLDAEIIDGFRDHLGNITINLVTSKNRKAGCQVRLEKKFDFMPTKCRFTYNAATDPLRRYKHGEVYSSVTTEWEKSADGNCLPKRVTISVEPRPDRKMSHQCDFRLEWLPLKEHDEILFSEQQLRNRWDTVESLLGYVGSVDEKRNRSK